MPEYLSPGVYVEELSGAIKPIQGVSTSTTGFVGQTERGPLNVRLVTSWPMFERWFGGHIEPSVSYLPYAVQGFFANGGQRLFVARVTRAGAKTAGRALDTAAGNVQLRIQANGPGIWGRRIYVRVQQSSKKLPGQFRLTLLYFRVPPPDPFVNPLDRNQIANDNRREPDVTEDYDNLSADPRHAGYVTTVVNAASQLLRLEWSDPSQPSPPPAPEVGEFAPLEVDDDADGADTPTSADYTGNDQLPPDQRTGLAGLETIDQISLLGVPDSVNTSGTASRSWTSSRAKARSRTSRTCSPAGPHMPPSTIRGSGCSTRSAGTPCWSRRAAMSPGSTPGPT
jgi:Bacteriophage tail sheath protein